MSLILYHHCRALREKWESFSDTLTESQRKMEVCLLQWSSYDDSFEQFQRWLTETVAAVTLHDELQATLPEKKAQLQNHKVCLILCVWNRFA